MRGRMLRLSLALFALAVGTLPGTAFAMPCDGILTNGEIACHAVSGTCAQCTFSCSDGSGPTWNVCHL